MQLTKFKMVDSCFCMNALGWFEVSAGRSGSTTVLEMLNQIPGYDIMGENQWLVFKKTTSNQLEQMKMDGAGHIRIIESIYILYIIQYSSSDFDWFRLG